MGAGKPPPGRADRETGKLNMKASRRPADRRRRERGMPVVEGWLAGGASSLGLASWLLDRDYQRLTFSSILKTVRVEPLNMRFRDLDRKRRSMVLRRLRLISAINGSVG